METDRYERKDNVHHKGMRECENDNIIVQNNKVVESGTKKNIWKQKNNVKQ